MATQITNLTNFADQVTQLQLVDGTVATMELVYQGAVEAWTISVSYPTANFESDTMTLCCIPNVLRQWQKTLPFGISCVTADQTNPFDINDFANNRVLMFLLTTADLLAIEQGLYSPNFDSTIFLQVVP